MASAAACCVLNESFYARAALSFGELDVLAVGHSRGAAPVPRVQLGELVEGLGKHVITTVSPRGEAVGSCNSCLANRTILRGNGSLVWKA